MEIKSEQAEKKKKKSYLSAGLMKQKAEENREKRGLGDFGVNLISKVETWKLGLGGAKQNHNL